jgi:hypothetical protein
MELKDKVLRTINCALRDREYIGQFDVKKFEDIYILKLYLNQPDHPISISYQGSEQEFLDCLYKEISQRQLDKTVYCTAVQTDPGNDFYHVTINEY